MSFNPFDYPIIWAQTPWIADAPEVEHQALGRLLVDLLRPSRIVDVGSTTGAFYTALVQAVEDLSISSECSCLLAATGAGDAKTERLLRIHAGFPFSRVEQMSETTDLDAVDLLTLHPGMLHSGELDADRAPDKWMETLTSSGIVLLHGSNVGSLTSQWHLLVRRLEESHPHLKFLHGEGVECFVMGDQIPSPLKAFAQGFAEQTGTLRCFFEELGTRARLVARLNGHELLVEELREEMRGVKASLNQNESELNHTKSLLTQAEFELDQARSEKNEMEQQLDLARSQVAAAQAALHEVEDSSAWKAISAYRSRVERALPNGSRRRAVYGAGTTALKRVLSRKRGGPRLARTPQESGVSLETTLTPFAFPTSKTPRVSIIIPTFNQPVYTYNALRALVAEARGLPIEVIVVDDASTDQTGPMLQTLDGVRVSTNKENLGFTRSCNAGFELASGEFILLLNNDALVQEGCVGALVELMERDASVGAVGAKLVYPDGRLQEAGAILWNDATGMNYGRLDDPNRGQYNYLREVDYCSASCLLVRRNLIEKLDGFDLRYAPAYYEDTDLAFAIRSLGYKVMYQPRAEVIHYEGVSHGYDQTKGIKRFQEINRQKFAAKWKDVLVEHLPRQTDPLVAKDRLYPSVILVADEHVPTPDRDSGSMRMFSLLRMLTESGRKVVFLPADRDLKWPYADLLQQLGIEVVDPSVDLAAYLQAITGKLETVLLSRPLVAERLIDTVRKQAPNARILYDTVDLHYLRMHREAGLRSSRATRLSANRMRRKELELASASDGVIVVSDIEKKLLEDEVAQRPIYVVPNVHPSHKGAKPFDERTGLLFVGGFLHPPNADAVIHFVNDIFPELQRRLPGITLRVIGSNVTPTVVDLAQDGVEVLGWVPELEPYLHNSRLFVAPLRFGAGLKGKVGQAMSAGLPGVMTSVAAEGFDFQTIREHVVADDPNDFADAVVRMYTDAALWTKVADAGAEIVDELCSVEAVRTRLEEALQGTSVKSG